MPKDPTAKAWQVHRARSLALEASDESALHRTDAVVRCVNILLESTRLIAEPPRDVPLIAALVSIAATLGHGASLWLLTPDGRELVPAASHAEDPGRAERLARVDAREGIFARVLATGVAHVHVEGRREAIVLPVRARGRTFGVLSISRPAGGGAPSDAERAVAEDLALRIAITLEMARLDEDARAEHRRLDAVIQQMPCAVAIADAASGRMIVANTQHEALFPQCAAGQVEDYRRCVATSLDGAPLSVSKWPLERAMLRGETVASEEINVLCVDGTRVTLRCNAAPLRDAEGTVVSGVATYQDVTLEKLAEDEMRALYSEAREAVRVRDEFLSIASHELRTPVTSLQLHVEGILRRIRKGVAGATDPESLSAKLQAASRQIARLDRLVGELLDVSRISAGRLELTVEDLDLGELARDVAQRFEHEVAAAGASLDVEAAGIIGRWDKLRLDQVLTNLVSNAIKYGGGTPIRIVVRESGRFAEVSVTDGGIGIDLEHQARIFDRFERLVSSRHFGGFGLGLWICRQIVEASGGTVSVVSRPGMGSTFVVRLPR